MRCSTSWSASPRRPSTNPADAELWYDTIVAFGELVSTTIISEYLNYAGVSNRWIDMRRCFLTEQRHKDAGVDIEASAPLLKNALGKCVENIFVGQGFIGGAPDGTTTTLGREGSDYSAAVVANILDAESMSVWKDVDGVLNADPKTFPDAVQIAELNYLDTIELAYSGAQIIHPKTIKPLQNKNIPLYVRPFGDKRKPGTVIRGMSAPVDVPILILKKDQVLLTIRSRDFSFVLEEKFATIFSLLERFRIKTNLIHNSAVNLSLCVDNSWHIDEAIEALREAGFDVMKAENMELLDRARLYRRAVAQVTPAVRRSSCGRPRSPPCAWSANGNNRSQGPDSWAGVAGCVSSVSAFPPLFFPLLLSGAEFVDNADHRRVADFAVALHVPDRAGDIPLDVAFQPFVKRAFGVVFVVEQHVADRAQRVGVVRHLVLERHALLLRGGDLGDRHGPQLLAYGVEHDQHHVVHQRVAVHEQVGVFGRQAAARGAAPRTPSSGSIIRGLRLAEQVLALRDVAPQPLDRLRAVVLDVEVADAHRLT